MTMQHNQPIVSGRTSLKINISTAVFNQTTADHKKPPGAGEGAQEAAVGLPPQPLPRDAQVEEQSKLMNISEDAGEKKSIAMERPSRQRLSIADTQGRAVGLISGLTKLKFIVYYFGKLEYGHSLTFAISVT